MCVTVSCFTIGNAKEVMMSETATAPAADAATTVERDATQQAGDQPLNVTRPTDGGSGHDLPPRSQPDELK